MSKSIRLNGGLFWDSTSLWNTLGEKPNITNGDLNDTRVMGTYFISAADVGNVSNVPFSGATCLAVVTFNDGSRAIQMAINSSWERRERFYNGESWSEWLIVPHFRNGHEDPSSDLGVEGDFYARII